MSQDHIRTYKSSVSSKTLEVDLCAQPKRAVSFMAQENKKAISCALSLADARALAEHLLSIPEVANATHKPEPMTTATVLGLIRNRAQDDHGACGAVHDIVDLCLERLDPDLQLKDVDDAMRVLRTAVGHMSLAQTETIVAWAETKTDWRASDQNSHRDNTNQAIEALVRLLVPELCAQEAPLTAKTGPIEVGDIVVYTGTNPRPVKGPTPVLSISSCGYWHRIELENGQTDGWSKSYLRHATPAEIDAFNAKEASK